MRLLPVLISAAVAGSIASATPAHAGVTFDFHTNTGFADAEDVRQGLGWDAAKLRTEAPKLTFKHNTRVTETWSVTCDDGRPFEAERIEQSMTEFLVAAVTYRPGGTEVAGFRITGSDMGMSSTMAPFLPDVTCPESDHGKTIRSSRQLATTTTRYLLAEAGTTSASLAELRTGPEVGE
ncbi:hypothetical protein Ait01nite_090150 [Actinoplanes italicus]|uniref:Uncharacterized protein n=1 Tax=Actinoplanes italicus TaxID=113567 RepID=A0A2T0JDB3_9ACTN|nr:hypothetical protein [Actinoplanes italicus]PRX05530.1 hypothetical protein CLV67_14510 [Actinoplanes italicus]GIE35970.1 hypothetical protein Ait01nite_090150 [Actinoplanes italicus]